MSDISASFRFSILVLAEICILTCCVSLVAAQAKRQQSVYAVLDDAPKSARERKNPFAGDPREATAGRKLFEQHCAECHGKTAGGSMRGANLLSDEIQQAKPGTLFWILTNGIVRHGMPVWSKLPEPQRWQIITYVQSLKPQPAHQE